MSEVKAEEAIESQIPTPSIPKDLQAHLETINAFAQTNAVLHKASYPPQIFQAAMDCIGFIKEAHAKTVEKALTYPSAELVPELKELKDKLNSEPKAKV